MAEKVSVNVRFPASLHQGLVGLASRDHRSLNDQIIYYLSKEVVHQLTPQQDPLHILLSRMVKDLYPYIEFWGQKYSLPEIDLSHPPTDIVQGMRIETENQREYIAKMMIIQERMERALVEFVHAYRRSEEVRNAHQKEEEQDE